MTNQVQHRRSSIWIWSRLRKATNALALGAVLLAGATAARSQETNNLSKLPAYTVLYTFTGGADGANPLGGNLLLDREGNLYGTTGSGGNLSCSGIQPPGCGVVFKLGKTGEEIVLNRFTGTDGTTPYAGVIRDEDGNFYGTTGGGGPFGAGVVFKLDKTGRETVLYSFAGGADGSGPGGVIRDNDGNLYGTTAGGGSGGAGVVFKLDRTGKETVLYNFTGGPDGGSPYAELVRDQEGNLYSTTVSGGDLTCTSLYPPGCGVVFKLDRAGIETVLHTFTGTDGANPVAGLILDKEGNLYGTASEGGDLSCNLGLPGCGVVFKLDRQGTETVLHAFTATDGGYPLGDLLRDEEGNLYGTTYLGGDLGWGVVFRLDGKGKETVLYSFENGADGRFPQDGLARDAEGNLYGAASYGADSSCSYGCGVVFKLEVPDYCKPGELPQGSADKARADADADSH